MLPVEVSITVECTRFNITFYVYVVNEEERKRDQSNKERERERERERGPTIKVGAAFLTDIS